MLRSIPLKDLQSHTKELLWFLVTFILFIASGPFCIFAVIPALFSLPVDEKSLEYELSPTKSLP